MGLGPILALTRLDRQFDVEGNRRIACVFHDLFGNSNKRLGIGSGHLKQQLIMHLEQHFRIKMRDGLGHFDHGTANDIGGCALNGRVNRSPFGKPRA